MAAALIVMQLLVEAHRMSLDSGPPVARPERPSWAESQRVPAEETAKRDRQWAEARAERMERRARRKLR